MKLYFLIPGESDWSIGQEECCWKAKSRYTPALALNAISYLRDTGHSVSVCRPDQAPHSASHAMIFSWAFGDDLHDAAERCSHLIANPSSTAAELRKRFPAAIVIPASDVFRDDLDLAPLVDWPHAFSRIFVQSSSGCVHRCNYCPWDHSYRKRPAATVAADIHRLLGIVSDPREVALHCNEITGDSQWLRYFCDALGSGVHWRTEGNIRTATHQDLLIAHGHGLAEIGLGIEALDDSLLATLHKGHTVADAFRVFEWLQDLGIRYRFSLRQHVGETVGQLIAQLIHLEEIRQRGFRPDCITIGPMDGWPGSRWTGSEASGSTRYPRYIIPWPSRIIAELWREIREAAAEFYRNDRHVPLG